MIDLFAGLVIAYIVALTAAALYLAIALHHERKKSPVCPICGGPVTCISVQCNRARIDAIIDKMLIEKLGAHTHQTAHGETGTADWTSRAQHRGKSND
jgi:hypothetical protein